jgi:hypothetical protein
MPDNDLYLLEFNKNPSKLSFNEKISSLEFVEIIGNMDLNQCINYKKRDVYLKKHGKQLFKKFPLYKKRERKLQIEIKHQTEYLSSKNNNSKKFFDGLNKTIKNIFKWKIIVTVSIIKYKYGSTVNIKPNNYNNCSKKSIDNYSTEVLSQEEIDMLLTAINIDDENNKK